MYRRRLTILNPITDDSGTYLCEASFSRPGGVDLPTALAEANLTVLGMYSEVTRFRDRGIHGCDRYVNMQVGGWITGWVI